MADQQKAKENAHRALMVEVAHRYLKGNGVTLPSEQVWDLVRNCATPEYGTYRLRNWLKGQSTQTEEVVVTEPVQEEFALAGDRTPDEKRVDFGRKHSSTCGRPVTHKGKCSPVPLKNDN